MARVAWLGCVLKAINRRHLQLQLGLTWLENGSETEGATFGLSPSWKVTDEEVDMEGHRGRDPNRVRSRDSPGNVG
jgi:hypothetical protein